MNIKIPRDVSEFVNIHFRNCNNQVTKDLSTFPAIHEEFLDMSFISYFSRNQTPVMLPCNWVVRIDAHFIGGGRHFRTWEVADIGLMIVFRRSGKVVKSKIALLQSKKLYADNLKYLEENKYFRRFGLGRLLVTNEEHSELVENRLLVFKENSKYRAYKKDSNQQDAMRHFERRWDTKMYYLFYNPANIPHSVKMPMEGQPSIGENVIGCRVIPKDQLDLALSSKKSGYIPSYQDVSEGLPTSFSGQNFTAGWRLEDFVSELMLECKEGLVDDSPNFESLRILMEQKSMPMSCALSITFDIQDRINS